MQTRKKERMSAPAEEPTLFDSMVKPKLSPAYPDRAPWGTSVSLRAWQAEAMQKYFETNPRDFMAVATPGAGKTTFALTLAKELFNRGTVRQLIVVAPTDHLKKQWADAAAKVGIPIDPNFKNADVTISRHYKGVALTYAQVANKPQLHARNTEETKTLVIFDEIHHAGDSLSWGDGLREAFDDATRRVALTGTPFRSDTSPIPFVTYEVDNDGIRRSKADYSYGYGPALKDHVVRPVIFMAYSGQMRWRTSAGEEMAANLGEGFTKDITSQAWRTALDPNGEWIPTVLAAADKRLTEVRRTVPDAGALVIATDHADAKAYAEQIQKITGEYPAVILSDDREASAKIDEFREGTQRWMVAVRMVSEGVDVPRLAVGVYATNASTPLFFAQAIGRYVRARRRGETATVFIPSVVPLLTLAGDMEVERDHALDRPRREEASEDDMWNPEDALVAAANREEKASSDLLSQFEVLGADAEFDGVLFDGAAWGAGAEVGSEEEQEYLGIPGLLDADQVTTLLRARQADQVAAQKKNRAAQKMREDNAGIPAHKLRAAKRKELQHLVSTWSRRSGETHATIHSRLRSRCGGPEVAQATTEQIEARIALLREWFVGRH